MNGKFERARVKLHTHFDPAVGTINADAEQLWQAMLNLIRNSLEAMPDGGELTIGTWREGGQVRLRVTDTGKGMSEEQLKQVFAPFFTTKPSGTGLGLALVQQIVTEHGGHLECESAQRQGQHLHHLSAGAEKRTDMTDATKHFAGGRRRAAAPGRRQGARRRGLSRRQRRHRPGGAGTIEADRRRAGDQRSAPAGPGWHRAVETGARTRCRKPKW